MVGDLSWAELYDMKWFLVDKEGKDRLWEYGKYSYREVMEKFHFIPRWIPWRN